MRFPTFYAAMSASLVLLICTVETNAETLSFVDVWKKISRSSPALEGAKLKAEAADQSRDRAERHWLPRIYLEAKTYRTNDPGASFMGVLEQRKLEPADLSTDELNHPAAHNFSRGALGIDIALYEGGAKKAQASMYDHLSVAEHHNEMQTEIEQYSVSGVAYASISSLRRQKSKLKDLSRELEKLMKEYQLGRKSNPVGYSGLLGMKSLANRITGLIDQFDSQERAHFASLSEMGVHDHDWSPQLISSTAFVDLYFRPKLQRTRESHRNLAIAASAQASEEMAQMERARFIPRVGAFAESYAFNGNRDTANGYTAGLYMQWNLFDPNDYGRYREAKLAAAAAQKWGEASALQERVERFALGDSVTTLKNNLTRLEDSDKLLIEQTQVSTTLFRNGSIGALQFVEILNRRTDLIHQQTEMELSLLKISASLIAKFNFEISNVTSAGGEK